MEEEFGPRLIPRLGRGDPLTATGQRLTWCAGRHLLGPKRRASRWAAVAPARTVWPSGRRKPRARQARPPGAWR